MPIGIRDETETAHLYRLLASVAHVDHVINKSTGKKSDLKHANHQANWDKHLGAKRAERVSSPGVGLVVLLNGQLKQELFRLQCRL